MTLDPEAGVVESFRSVIAHRLGLQIDESRPGVLADLLRRRTAALGQSAGAYLSRLETQPFTDEIAALALELTVPETYFFRHAEQYCAFTGIVLADRLVVEQAHRRLRILSLGCASGDEAYSLAILALEGIPDPTWTVSVLGIDVNPAMIEKARRGRFTPWALRETSDDAKARWFRSDGRDFLIDARLRAVVRFEQRNLIDNDPQLWLGESYDVVFCRNVIMYFGLEQAETLIGRISRVLAPGGYLFLGHAETLRGLSHDFHLRHTHGAFYYQRKDRPTEVWPLSPQPAESRPLPTASLAAIVSEAQTWVEAIGRAAERVAALTDPPRPGTDRLGSAEGGAPTWDLGLALELMGKERFAEALAIIDALPPESGSDADVLLLRAVLLTHGGHLSAAEHACRRLLQVDDLNAGAHYLLALCREGAGDRSGAAEHDQIATYLDPGFAMPHLHLGLLAGRAGDAAGAREAIEQALQRLQREDPSRILLFGGGFSREALVRLCRTALQRGDVRP